MDIEHERVPFLAPVFAAMMAPAVESARAAARAAVPAVQLVRIRCPRTGCGRVLALWWELNELLYPPPRDGQLGVPLSADRAKNVRLRCGQCRKGTQISGRAIGRNLVNGRPPLG